MYVFMILYVFKSILCKKKYLIIKNMVEIIFFRKCPPMYGLISDIVLYTIHQYTLYTILLGCELQCSVVGGWPVASMHQLPGPWPGSTSTRANIIKKKSTKTFILFKLHTIDKTAVIEAQIRQTAVIGAQIRKTAVIEAQIRQTAVIKAHNSHFVHFNLSLEIFCLLPYISPNELELLSITPT